MKTKVSTTIKGMVKERANPTSVRLTIKERKVLLEYGIDARAFVGNRKQKVAHLNEQVALYMKPAFTDAQIPASCLHSMHHIRIHSRCGARI